MDKIECYECAMLAIMRDKVLLDGAKLKVLEVLMEARNIEKSMVEARSAYQANQEPQELAE